MAKAKRRDTPPPLDELSDAALAGVDRADLVDLLRAVSVASPYIVEWDSTAIMHPDAWSRISASAVRCLERVELKGRDK